VLATRVDPLLCQHDIYLVLAEAHHASLAQ
jgi:hypothetical protein